MQQYLQVLLFMRQLNKGKIIKGGIIVQKKKVLIIIIILLVITLVAGGLVIYLCTDLFKSDKQLFYKYLLDKNEMLSVLDEIEFKQDSKSYTAKTNVESIYEYDNEIEKYENDQIMKNLQENVKSFEYIKNLNANIESKVDKENEKQYHEIHIKNNDDEITKIEAVRNEDKYAVKVEDILKAYIGIENNNVKELASKFEIKDADKIPDKIDYENKMYKDLFKISKEEKERYRIGDFESGRARVYVEGIRWGKDYFDRACSWRDTRHVALLFQNEGTVVRAYSYRKSTIDERVGSGCFRSTGIASLGAAERRSYLSF